MKTKFFVVAFFFSLLAAHATVRTWDGGGTNNNFWSNALNWSANVAPVAGDDLVFPAGAAQVSNTNDFPAGTLFNTITISSNSYSIVGNAILINKGVHGTFASSFANFGLPMTLVTSQTFTNSGNARLQFNGPITNAGFTLTLQINAGTNLFQIGASIHGAGGLIKNGTGLLRFTGIESNTYSGTTFVNAGTVELAKNPLVVSIPGPLVIGDGIGGTNADVLNNIGGHQIADTSPVTINSSGLLIVAVSDTMGGLTGNGNVSLTGNSCSVNLAAGTNIFSGTISGGAGLGFTKSGAGTMILTGTNTYLGQTVVQGGIMQIDGFQPNSYVYLGGTTRLRGSGTVGSIEMNGSSSRVSPGTSPGILTCNHYKLGAGSGFLDIELNGINPGSGYDQVKASGNINLSSVSLNVSLNFPSARSNQFVIVNNLGANPVSVPFNALPEGTVFFVAPEQFRISYVGGDGNDVVLTQITGSLPQLFVDRVPTNAVRLSWATNFSLGFNLESNSNLTTTNWINVAPASTVIGTNNVVTNPITAAQTFYRLRKN
ncbi:MAG: autotransporter-associated beta strand repeat-containing protein [Verrucomicrobiota bacterium]